MRQEPPTLLFKPDLVNASSAATRAGLHLI